MKIFMIKVQARGTNSHAHLMNVLETSWVKCYPKITIFYTWGCFRGSDILILNSWLDNNLCSARCVINISALFSWRTRTIHFKCVAYSKSTSIKMTFKLKAIQFWFHWVLKCNIALIGAQISTLVLTRSQCSNAVSTRFLSENIFRILTEVKEKETWRSENSE